VDDGQLKRGAWDGIVEFQRIIGTHAPAARLTDNQRFVASAVPDVPSSLINAAVPRGGAPLAPHLDEIEDFYAGSRKWGAWLDPAATDDAEALRARGLVLDSTPVLMAAALDDIAALGDAPAAHQVTMEEVGTVNDLAYGNPQPVITRTLNSFPADAMHAYGIRVADEIASVAMIVDTGRDAFVTMVSTLPHQRGKHLASKLLAHALHEARRRGQTTTSLQASKLGQGIYARLGYRPLGEVHLYEKRPP
jgi:ribosomal protein S18 acetylase RimI-like enzyme